MELEQIKNNYTYHPPKDKAQQELYSTLRREGKGLAFIIQDFCPESREKSIAMTKLEEVIMWANASIARNQ